MFQSTRCRIIYFLALAFALVSRLLPAQTEPAASSSEQQATPALFAFLIQDKPRRFNPTDDNGVRYQAAQLALALADDDDYFLLIRFHTTAEPLVALTRVGDKASRLDISRRIDNRNPLDETGLFGFVEPLSELTAQLQALPSAVDMRLIIIASESNKRDILYPSRSIAIAETAKSLAAMRASGKLSNLALTALMLHPTDASQSLYDMARLIGGRVLNTDTRYKMVSGVLDAVLSTKPFQKREMSAADPRSRLFIVQPGQEDIALIVGSRRSMRPVIENVRLLGPDMSVDLSESSTHYSYPSLSITVSPIDASSTLASLSATDYYQYSVVRLTKPLLGIYEMVGDADPDTGRRSEVIALLTRQSVVISPQPGHPPAVVIAGVPFPVGISIHGKPKDILARLPATTVTATIEFSVGLEMKTISETLVPILDKQDGALHYAGMMSVPREYGVGLSASGFEAKVYYRIVTDYGESNRWESNAPPVSFRVVEDEGRISVEHMSPAYETAVSGDEGPVFPAESQKKKMTFRVSSTFKREQSVSLTARASSGGVFEPIATLTRIGDNALISPKDVIVMNDSAPLDIELTTAVSVPGRYGFEIIAERLNADDKMPMTDVRRFAIDYPPERIAMLRFKPEGDALSTDEISLDFEVKIAANGYADDVEVDLSITRPASLSRSGESLPLASSFFPSSPVRLSKNGTARTVRVSVSAPTDGVYPFALIARVAGANLSATDAVASLSYSAVFRKRDIYLNTKNLKLDLGRYPLDAAPEDSIQIDVPGKGPYIHAARPYRIDAQQSIAIDLSRTPTSYLLSTTARLKSRDGTGVNVLVRPALDRIINQGSHSQLKYFIVVPTDQTIQPGTYVGEVSLLVLPQLAGSRESRPVIAKRMELRVEFFDPLEFHKRWLPWLFGVTVLALLVLFIWLTRPQFAGHQIRIARQGEPLQDVYQLSLHTHGMTGGKARGAPEFPRALLFALKGFKHFSRIQCLLTAIRDDIVIEVNDVVIHPKGCLLAHGDKIVVRRKADSAPADSSSADSRPNEATYFYYEYSPKIEELPKPKKMILPDDAILVILD